MEQPSCVGFQITYFISYCLRASEILSPPKGPLETLIGGDFFSEKCLQSKRN